MRTLTLFSLGLLSALLVGSYVYNQSSPSSPPPESEATLPPRDCLECEQRDEELHNDVVSTHVPRRHAVFSAGTIRPGEHGYVDMNRVRMDPDGHLWVWKKAHVQPESDEVIEDYKICLKAMLSCTRFKGEIRLIIFEPGLHHKFRADTCAAWNALRIDKVVMAENVPRSRPTKSNR